MTSPRDTLAVAVALAACVALQSAEARAQSCACPATRPPPVALAESDAVFEGQVTGVRDGPYVTGTSEAAPGRWVSLLVLREWKGATAGTTRHVFTPTACGVPFETATTWVVYAGHGGANHDLRTSRCHRTRVVSDAREDLLALGIPGTQILGVSAGEVRPRAPVARAGRGMVRGAVRRVIRRNRHRPAHRVIRRR